MGGGVDGEREDGDNGWNGRDGSHVLSKLDVIGEEGCNRRNARAEEILFFGVVVVYSSLFFFFFPPLSSILDIFPRVCTGLLRFAQVCVAFA